MLAPGTDIEALYHTACENLARDVEFVIGNTWYGAFGIIADGFHEASSLCFKHIWQVCVDKLKDDLVIMVPSKDTVCLLYTSREQYDAVLITIGASTDKKLGLEGEDADGVYSAVQFLRNVGKEQILDLTGKQVAVIGGGNVSMDAVLALIHI